MEDNNQLPEGWKWVKLGDAFDFVGGGTPSKDEASYWNGNIPWASVKDIKNENLLTTEDSITNEGLKNSASNIAVKDEVILVSRISPGRVTIAKRQIAINQDLKIVKPRVKTLPKFIIYYFQAFGREIIKKSSGTTVLGISLNNLREILYPQLEYSLQKSIVVKVEELFSELDKGVENLRLAQQQLKTYRQAVLKAAFKGRLTNEDVKDGKLPQTWTNKKLSSVADTCLGKMLDKNKNKGKNQYYLGNINVRWGTFDLADLKQMKFEDNDDERYGIAKGDLIICEGGEPGRCAIWNNEIENMKIQKALHRVRVKEGLFVNFLFYYISFSSLTGLLERYFTGTTIKHLTGNQLKEIDIPFPSRNEQTRIVELIELRFSAADKVTEEIEQCLQYAESLRQSILKTAFEGKLLHETSTIEKTIKQIKTLPLENVK